MRYRHMASSRIRQNLPAKWYLCWQRHWTRWPHRSIRHRSLSWRSEENFLRMCPEQIPDRDLSHQPASSVLLPLQLLLRSAFPYRHVFRITKRPWWSHNVSGQVSARQRARSQGLGISLRSYVPASHTFQPVSLRFPYFWMNRQRHRDHEISLSYFQDKCRWSHRCRSRPFLRVWCSCVVLLRLIILIFIFCENNDWKFWIN